MTIEQITKVISGTVVCGHKGISKTITGGYCSDLLSDVIANAKEGDIWITLQRHSNIVAVAHLKGVVAIVLVNNRIPEEECIKRANELDIPIISTPLPCFDCVGLIYNCGIRGFRE